MVVRLFVPPGEGQDNLIPRRPDAIGANATLQYTVLASTGLAAAYTSFATSYQRRVRPQHPVSRTALFIQSSARYGLWAGALGAAANWYYYSAFATVAAAKVVPDVKPWKLYERTKTFTVEDGLLAGAALGAVTFIPTLLLRRPAIPRWTRCVGMAHIGACAGVLGAHGYLEYIGERQTAYQCLERRTKQKNLELWAIFWDKELMAQFNPFIQLYIRNNGIWHASLLPENAFQPPHEHSTPVVEQPNAAPAQDAKLTTVPIEEEKPYYIRPLDYAEQLRTMDVPATLLEIERLEREKAALLAEADLLLSVNAANQYKYCHSVDIDDDDRRARLQHMFVIEITYTRLKGFANAIDEKLLKYHLALQHQAQWTGSTDTSRSDSLANWLPVSVHGTRIESTKPDAAIKDLEDLHALVSDEVKRFQEWSADVKFEPAWREKWKQDAEDGMVLLKAVDEAVYVLGKHRQRVEEAEKRDGAREVARQRQMSNVEAESGGKDGNAEVVQVGAGDTTPSAESVERGKQTRMQTPTKTAPGSPNGGVGKEP
ncbi:hypothetical protein NX059_006166 [Plenodomus lindquistii]|nr:hypothetical protein NX059_006166 [Plenodomus lindquistii]